MSYELIYNDAFQRRLDNAVDFEPKENPSKVLPYIIGAIGIGITAYVIYSIINAKNDIIITISRVSKEQKETDAAPVDTVT